LCSDRKTVPATSTDILKADNEPSEIPAVSEFIGIFELQNSGLFRDERSELSVNKRWLNVEASDEIPNFEICEGRIDGRESFDGVGNFEYGLSSGSDRDTMRR
jgi:hypothetical protein